MKEKFSFPSNEDFSDVIEEKNEPVKNLVESLEKLYYFKGKVTKPSKFNRSEDDPLGKERPLFLRKRRADILHDIKEVKDPARRAELINKAKLLDEITAQYMNQQDVFVNFPDFGPEAVGARVSVIKPSSELINEKSRELDPIFFIPGISNDIECVNNTIVEMALNGREVIAVGYPEGFSGHATEGFTKAVEEEPGVKAHADFFKEVFRKVQKEYKKPLEMWGLSMGCPITTHILNDPDFQQKVSKAVLLFPAQSVDIKPAAMAKGVLQEFNYLKNKAATINWTVGSNREIDSKQLNLRKKILSLNTKKMLAKDESWKQANVRAGGDIVIVSGLKDEITKSYLADKEFEQDNSLIRVLELSQAHHMTINSQPEIVMSEIMEFSENWPYYVKGEMA